MPSKLFYGGKNSMEKQKVKQGKKLVCQRCKHIWTYQGDAVYWTSCPICKTSVSVRQVQEDMPVDLPAQKT